MKADLLLEHYERIADAPDAVACLRRFVLDLAVRGKLVPQDARDEPASELLKRIAGERARLSLREASSPLSGDEAPFELPTGWSWTRLGDICSKTGSGSTPRGGKNVYKPSGVPFLRSQNVHNDRLRLDDIVFIDPQVHEQMKGTRVLPGDLLLNITGGSMGRCGRVPEGFGEANVSQHVAIIRTAVRGMDGFLHGLILSPYFQAFIFDEQTGAGRGGLPKNRMDRIVLALPPSAEQLRIVAQVNELMGLCDQLEAARTAREDARDRLTAASLARLNAPHPDTFSHDARVVLNALPALTTRPDQIKALRQTILNLAVRGKLVPQDANDEPASELLDRLHRERTHKRTFAQINHGDFETPLPDLPSRWLWTTTDQISADDNNAITDGPFGSQLKTDHYIEAPGFRVIRLQNVGGGAFREEHRSYIDQSRYERLSKHHVKAGDLVVAGLVDPSVRCCEVPADIGPALVKADCYRFSVHPTLSSRYVLHCLNSPLTQGFAAVHHHGMTLTRIGLGNFRRIPFPLPPLTEQHRIVAKVDELLGLCDQLEASLTAGTVIRRRLLDALLAEALAPVPLVASEWTMDLAG